MYLQGLDTMCMKKRHRLARIRSARSLLGGDTRVLLCLSWARISHVTAYLINHRIRNAGRWEVIGMLPCWTGVIFLGARPEGLVFA